MKKTQNETSSIKIRPLEGDDLRFVHKMNNNPFIMRYWFEEPYEAYVELKELYYKHIHDQSERRFIIEHQEKEVGIVELVEIDYIHRRCEFQIIIDTKQQGKGFASSATALALNYAFNVLNLHKIYLLVDVNNKKAIHIYTKLGFKKEGILLDEFFANGTYQSAMRMCLFQKNFNEK